MPDAVTAVTGLEVTGAVRVVAHRPWPGSALAVAPGGEWVAVALPGRVVTARLPDLSDEHEIHVADVRSIAAISDDRLALAPHRGVLVIEDPVGAPRVAVRARGAGRVQVVAGPGGLFAAVGERAAPGHGRDAGRPGTPSRLDRRHRRRHGCRLAGWT
jgi:hypothetical protein